MAQTWVYIVVTIAIGHLIATMGVYYWLGRGADRTDDHDGMASATGRRGESEQPQQPDQTATHHEDDVVVCPNCNTPNEPGYRYCRQCVSPIGMGSQRRGTTGGPDTRLIR